MLKQTDIKDKTDDELLEIWVNQKDYVSDVVEWVRAEIPVWGFGWNLLAYSQSFNLTIAGIGNLLGAYGLSWLMVYANLAVFFVLDFELSHKKIVPSRSGHHRSLWGQFLDFGHLAFLFFIKESKNESLP